MGNYVIRLSGNAEALDGGIYGGILNFLIIKII